MTAADGPAVAAMVARCTARSRRQRFQGGTHGIPAGYLARVCRPEPGDLHVVALASPSCVVALASVSEGELGVLVDDEWQGTGIGSLLLRRLLLHAGASGTDAVVAEVGAGNDRVLLALRGLRPRRVVPHADGWRVELEPWRAVRSLDDRARVRSFEAA